MIEFVLIVFQVAASGRTNVEMHNFTSMATCNFAAEAIIKEARSPSTTLDGVRNGVAAAFCLQR